jgi:hypothetical protein
MRKKIAATALSIMISMSYVYAQNRIQTLEDGILLFGTSKQKTIDNFKKKGFTYSGGANGVDNFKKDTWQGEFTYTVGYDKLNIVSVLSWKEQIYNFDAVFKELFELNFNQVMPPVAIDKGVFGYENLNCNVLISLVVKGDKTIHITMGVKNPELQVKKTIVREVNGYDEGGSGFGETPIALRKFTNLVTPQDDGLKTGKVAVRIKINKSGEVIDATPGVKGTTINDRELWQKCNDAIMDARLTQSESAPDVQIGIVVFNFKVK